MATIVTTVPDGKAIDITSLEQVLVYNADNTLNYIQVTVGESIYRQTMTYVAGNLTKISAWVKQ